MSREDFKLLLVIGIFLALLFVWSVPVDDRLPFDPTIPERIK